MGMIFPKPIHLQMDNAACQTFCEGTVFKSRLKHIDARQEWVRVLRNKSIVHSPYMLLNPRFRVSTSHRGLIKPTSLKGIPIERSRHSISGILNATKHSPRFFILSAFGGCCRLVKHLHLYVNARSR